MKQKLGKIMAFILMFCIVMIYIPVTEVKAASTTQLKADVTIDSNKMYEDETLLVNVNIQGIPYDDAREEPNDIIMILDKSGSMRNDFENLRVAAKSFVRKTLNNKPHRIGIVAFGNTVESKAVTTDEDELVEFLDSLVCDGSSTETGKGIEEAIKLLQSKRGNAQGAIVLMTDGENTDGDKAYQTAVKAKQNRYVFYTVAFCNGNSAADEVLRKMATSETDHYSVFASSKLNSVYSSISSKIGLVNPKNLIVTQTINAPFELVSGSADGSIPQPQIKGNTLTWSMNQLGGVLNLSYEIKLKNGSSAGKYTISSGYVQYTDYNGGTQLLNLPQCSVTVEAKSPEITSISPTSVLSGNAEEITLTGNNFNINAKIYVDTTEVKNVNAIDEHTIKFVMPDYVGGTATVKVVNPDKKQAVTSITVTPNSQITSIQADNCKIGESPIITITGSGFYGKAKTIKVKIGPKYATVKEVSGSTKIVCKVSSALAEGAYDVTVINASNKGTITKSNGFTVNPKNVPAPEISSVNPSTYVENTTNTIIIEGKNFSGTTKNLKVKIGDKYASLKNVEKTNDGCKITCTITSSLGVGTHDVEVQNSQGKRIAVKAQAYTRNAVPVPTPEVKEINPTTISSKNDEIVIKGTGFTDKISLLKVELKNTVTGVTKYASVKSASKTEIVIKAPASLTSGTYDVTVINYGNVKLHSPNNLTINW